MLEVTHDANGDHVWALDRVEYHRFMGRVIAGNLMFFVPTKSAVVEHVKEISHTPQVTVVENVSTSTLSAIARHGPGFDK